jgi:hypothetical protein
MHLVTWVRAGGELALAISLLSWYYHPMTKSTKKVVIPKKKRGRPFTGVDNRDPVMAIRISLEMRAEVEAWAADQPDHPDRSEAIRRMIAVVLKRKR